LPVRRTVRLAHGRLHRIACRGIGRAIVAALLLLLGSSMLAHPLSLAAELFAELRSFQGVVLVPSADLAPFTELEAWRVEMNRPLPGSTTVMRGRYLIQYRDPGDGAGSAQIGGAMGREELDQTLMALASRSFTRCPEDAAYCVENVAGQDDAQPASELFRGT
jgi:hypothetical protein